MTSIYKDDSWSVGEAHVGDLPVVVRARTHLPSASDRKLHESLIVISWPYEPGPSGMPERDVNDLMIRFEDSLEGTVEKRSGIQAASLTGNGSKEWRYYTYDKNEFMADLNAALTGHPVYPINIEMFVDSEWVALAELLPQRA